MATRLHLLALLSLLAACHGKDGAAAAENGGGRKGDPNRVVSVSVAKVEKKDVPIWMEGLASVSAWQQVTVRSQVDGRLDKVFFHDGQAVKRGEMLAQIDPRPYNVQLHQAEGALARDQAQLVDAKVNLERQQTLLEKKLVAQQAVDDQRAVAGQAAGNVKVDEAQIENAKLNIDYSQVRAPFDGVVGVRLVDPGNIVHASDPNGLVVLTQLDPVAVFVTVPQDDLATIANAMHDGTVPVEIRGRDGGAKIADGTLYALDNQINTSTATLKVKVQVPNPNHTLWPNEFVKARCLVETIKDAVVVPASAVQRGPQGAFVYLVGDDNKAIQQPVDIDRTTETLAIVHQLTPGASVVIDGQAQLRPGASVAIRDPNAPVQPSAPSGKKHDGKGMQAP